MYNIKNIDSKSNFIASTYNRLEEEILSIKKRELLVKYVALGAIVVPAFIITVQSLGLTIPFATTIMLISALLSLACTVLSIFNQKRVKKKEEELMDFESKLKHEEISFQERWSEWSMITVMMLNTLICLRGVTKTLNTDDYLSLALDILDLMGELLGNGFLLIGNVLGCISAIKSINNKSSGKNYELIAPCLILTGSSLLLVKRLILMTTLIDPTVIAPIATIAFACIIIGCAINIYSYRNKLDDVTVKQAKYQSVGVHCSA